MTNHYSPELRARISNIRINGVHSDVTTQMEPDVQKCRVHMQPLTGLKYLVSTAQLPPNTPVSHFYCYRELISLVIKY